MVATIFATLACLLIPQTQQDETELLSSRHVIEHGESAVVAGAGLVDAES